MLATADKSVNRSDLLVAEGQCFMEEQDLLSARHAFEGAVALIEADHGPQAKELIEPLWWLAKSYSAHKYEPCPEIEKAIAIAARALSLAEASPSNEPRLAVLLTFHGKLLWFNGLHERALEVIARARDLTTQWSSDTREETGLMAEILLHSAGRSADALVYARALVQQEEEVHGAATPYAHFLLADCLRQTGGREAEARSRIAAILARQSEVNTNDDEVKAIVQGWLDELDGKSAPGTGETTPGSATERT